MDRSGAGRPVRSTCAEIVDLELNSQVAQLMQHGWSVFGVLHKHAFGDLQPQTVGGESCVPQHLRDLIEQQRVGKLDTRDVDVSPEQSR
jgi:hypothetical protein